MDVELQTLGGPGSGNHGHAGRPGQVGGSSSNLIQPGQKSTSQIGDSSHNALLISTWKPGEPIHSSIGQVGHDGSIEAVHFAERDVLTLPSGGRLLGSDRVEHGQTFARLASPASRFRLHPLESDDYFERRNTPSGAPHVFWLQEPTADSYFAVEDYYAGEGVTVKGQIVYSTGLKLLNPQKLRAAGGPGSGNFSHSGRPGQVGGSSSTGEAARQEQLASRQTNPLAHPIAAIGFPSNSQEGQRYIAAYGQEFQASKRPENVYQDTPNQCYKNASLLVMSRPDLTYAEGFASKTLGGLAMLHAWGVDKDDNVVDSTLPNQESWHYFGVKYDRASYLKYLYKAGKYGVLGSTDKNARKVIDTGGAKLRAPLKTLGGPGSGNFSHAGRPGQIGGSRAGAFPQGLVKISGPKGSNPGGVFRDKDGQKWYVKNYKDADQAAGEHVANAVYARIGVDAADSQLSDDGKTIALRWRDGEILNQHGLDKETANRVLDGFAGDVLLQNWDAVGTGHDNVLVRPDGSVMRIDQGGTLLHRAQGAPKPEAGRHEIGEWTSLQTQNPYYSHVFKQAGVPSGDALGERAAKQIDRISAGRPTRGWESLVRDVAPAASEDFKKKAGAMLEARQQRLEVKRDQLRARSLGGPGSGHYGHAGRPGQVGGSADTSLGGGDVVIVKKAKAPSATKDQIATAVKMKAEGASYAQVQEATGLNPKQAATIVFKHKKAQAAAAQQLELNAKIDKLPATKPVSTSDAAAWEGASKKPADWASGGYLDSSQADLLDKGYEWKEKTTGPKKGNYAFFKDGVQVSANAPKGDMLNVVKTINQGKGPDWVKPAPVKFVPPNSLGGLIADKEGVATVMNPWPIDDSVVRRGGTVYLKTIEEQGSAWAKTLTPGERAAVKNYTGSGSHPINTALRAGKPLSSDAKLIDIALAKSPVPPPPELVWRGVPGVNPDDLVKAIDTGDIIRLKGFQSASVRPEKGSSWSTGQTLFEIRPRAGAYVGSISSHKGENEYLLPHGMKYIVRGSKKVPIGSKSILTRVIQLDMLDD